MMDQFTEMYAKELEQPDTVYIRDIESRVFQALTVKCLSDIDGVALLEGSVIDHLLGREGGERIKGVHVEQDLKNHAVSFKIELNITYGISIPEKCEEIQTKLVEDVVKFTGLHVASVHIVFRNIVPTEMLEDPSDLKKQEEGILEESEYTEEL